MANPFPGMNPYLEHPGLWPDVHQSLMTYARDELQAQVGERYFVALEQRVYLESGGRDVVPDVAVVETPFEPPRETEAALQFDEPVVLVLEQEVTRREVYLEIVDLSTGNEVVTVIEVLSPANKLRDPGRSLYLEKQAQVLASQANLVEIDLLRVGAATVAAPAHRLADAPYHVLVSRARDRRRRELYPASFRHRLPRVAVPLAGNDPDICLDLQLVLDKTYENGAFARRIRYDRDPEPPLSPDDLDWCRQRVAEN